MHGNEADGTVENPPKSNLDYLVEFLRQEVEREEQRDIMKNGFFEVKEEVAVDIFEIKLAERLVQLADIAA